ncbi:MAG TPA: hypothetical protein VJ779_00380 [Acetobacteraceae bacterium]|nr:hypothetical protein [Acetobacteraceae bacterium]
MRLAADHERQRVSALTDAPAAVSRPSFASFWAGQGLSALDKACLLSFVSGGHAVTLYSFEEIDNLPDGITLRDAREIAAFEAHDAFLYQGTPNLAHFSDYFRYQLMARSPHVWIDTDLLMLRPLDLDSVATLFAKESERSICNAILRIPGDDPALKEVIARTERLMHTNLVWGATGPRLLNQVLGATAVLKQAHPPNRFFPIHYNDFWKPFLPECAPECAEACRDAYTLHLWNNIVVRMGVWKELAPPEGSFLWMCLRERGLLHLFRDTYPAEVMRHMVTNWKFRKSGADIGVVQVARQVFPSMIRTTAPRVRALFQARR